MDKNEAKKRIQKLRKEINHHRYLYHVLDRQEISDAALDSLKRELAKLEDKFPDLITKNSPTQRVSGKPLSRFKKISHPSPMLSLNDAFSEKELEEWEIRIKKLIAGSDISASSLDYFAELKIDGFAISLIYENGILKTGSTRGDGKVGEDVTQNLKTIESIPLKLHSYSEIPREKEVKHILNKFPNVRRVVEKIPKSFEVRGEVYITKKSFGEVNKEQKNSGLPLFANPRNIAAGSVRQLDPKITASRKLDFIAYDIVSNLGQETHEEEHQIAKILGFKTAEPAKPCRNIKEILDFWKDVLSRREKLPFLIDGIVVQVNFGKLFERLGVVGKAPRGAVAFKFPAEEATTIIENIMVQVGRTGTLTPIAILKPIEVAGVTISRATLHNMDEIERLDARVRDTVIVQRAGDVIPDIVRVLKNLRPSDAKRFRMPRFFCGQRVVRKEGEVAHKIQHPEECELVQREKIYHFVSKNAFDISGLGPKIIDRLLDDGLIQDPADLFLLKEGDIKHLERFAEKSEENLIRAIQSRKKIDLSRFIYALGILHVGEETAIDLAKSFGTLKDLRTAKLEDFEKIPNIGEIVAKSIYDWLQLKKNNNLIDKLLKVGLRVQSAAIERKKAKLDGQTFVLTGNLESMTRNEAKKRLRELGGDVNESVSKNTDYVILGENPGSKYDKAKEFGVKIMNEKEFLNLIK